MSDVPAAPLSTTALPPRTLNIHHWAPPKKAAPYLDKVREVEELHEMPENLMAALVTQESQWDPKAESPVGARGLTQIMPQHHPGVDADDPDIAIEYGAEYLAKLKGRFGTWELALAAYNWGPGNLRKHGIENAPKETRDYIEKIMGNIHTEVEG
jgi:soluble lytic murein transglycosylase-like protein